MFPRTEYDRWCSFYGSWFQWKRKIQPRIQKNKYSSKKLCQQSHVSYLNLKTILPRSLKHRLHWKKKKKKERKKEKKPPWISYISNYSGVIFSLRYDGLDVPDTMNVHGIWHICVVSNVRESWGIPEVHSTTGKRFWLILWFLCRGSKKPGESLQHLLARSTWQ